MPDARRQILSALAVLTIVASLWAFIEWRSAPPPPHAAVAAPR